ncbi:alpha/beta hydrolase [Herbaspirillum sp. GCM10030257]|uniref:alpha/beta hydrolase n=1 Tax=Herbaspirillum sp. GCM10030257 TaxID=3273393 RepID=UPI00362393A4
MAIDPQAAAILNMFAAMPEPDYATLDAGAYRAIVAQQQLPMSNEAVASVEHFSMPGDGGPIALRVIRPGPGELPAIVFFHGGGWVSCNLDTHDNLCRRLANRSGCTVISVDYRLAPESPFPGPVNDACAALRWINAHAAALRIDPVRLAVCGDSAGGNLAAACAMLSRDSTMELPAIAHQLLFYPVMDAACDTGSFDTYARGYLLTRDMMRWFWKQYLRTPADADDSRACPLRTDRFAGLPAATVITAEFDPLRDEGARYAQCLSAAGVPVEYKCWDGVFHGFASMTGILGAADEALEFAAQAARRALA